MDQFSLPDSGFVYAYDSSDDGTIKNLFFAPKTSLKMVKRFHSVLLMDCTYKTNKFGMPFLDVVGIDCFNKTFFVCGVFMKSETQEMYEFALDAIKENIYQACTPPTPLPAVLAMDRDLGLKNAAEVVFESSQILICRWHINKNTLANCKKMFTEEDWEDFRTSWMSCMNSHTEDQWTTNWNGIVTTYATTHPAA
ncbi:hypothetical protein, partial, partial [Absidia glauca]